MKKITFLTTLLACMLVGTVAFSQSDKKATKTPSKATSVVARKSLTTLQLVDSIESAESVSTPDMYIGVVRGIYEGIKWGDNYLLLFIETNLNVDNKPEKIYCVGIDKETVKQIKEYQGLVIPVMVSGEKVTLLYPKPEEVKLSEITH